MTTEKDNIKLNLIHQNIQSFSSKILDIELLIEKYNLDLLCFTESWLKAEKMCFNINNFVVASFFNRNSCEGGGSIILIKNNLKYKERKDIVKLSVERVCEISCAEMDTYIILCIYRPPASVLSSFIDIMEDVLSKIYDLNKRVFVCGDFNIDTLIDSSETQKLISLFNSFNLNNIFQEPTRVTLTSRTCIDNIFSNCPFLDNSIITGVRSDHRCLFVSFQSQIKLTNKIVKYRPLTDNRLEILNVKIMEKLNSFVYNIYQPNATYSNLHKIINEEFNKVCKIKTKKINNKLNFATWATKGIRKSRDTLYELYDKRSFTSDQRFHDYVRDYSKLFKKVCIIAKSRYISSKINKAENKSKCIWNVINTETGKVNDNPNNLSIRHNGVMISDESEVATLFENFFTNIPFEITKSIKSSSDTAMKLLNRYSKISSIPEFFFSHVSTIDIIKHFKTLNKKKTEDLWGLSVKSIESFIHTIGPILADIFNGCVDGGIFPDLMKHSKIAPIFKSGCKTDPTNYRPVSVLPALSKIFEKIILNQLLNHFNNNKLLHTHQYGFTKGRNTTNAGTKLIAEIFDAWENSQDLVGVFCDLSKAFDCVDHKTLLSKLEFYGVRGLASNLIQSYLSNRTQCVNNNGRVSKGSLVRMGVPQGSILGPFLFLAYINDLPHMVEEMAHIVLFADDTSLLFKVDRKDNMLSTPNGTLTMVSEWFTANNLVLNAKKTKCLKFTLPNVPKIDSTVTLGGDALEFVDSTVFLGITVDTKLQWRAHINTLVKRLSSAAYAVRKIRQLTDVATARLVYFSYFHSIMTYGLIMWGSAADIDSIFILQKRAIRAIYRMRARESLREIFPVIDIMTLPSQYVFENLLYVKKNLSLFSKNADRHTLNLRNIDKLDIPKFRLQKTSKCFLINSIRLFNKLPKSIIEMNEVKFKHCIKETLIAKAYYKVGDYVCDKNVWNFPLSE